MEKQTVWISVSEPTTSGIFVWTVYEVLDGDDDKLYASKNYTPTLDNNYVYIPRCTHFWTQEEVNQHLKDYDNDSWYVNVIIVGKKND